MFATWNGTKVDIEIVTRPVLVRFDCPVCRERAEVAIEDVIDINEEKPSRWKRVICPVCNENLTIRRRDYI